MPLARAAVCYQVDLSHSFIKFCAEGAAGAQEMNERGAWDESAILHDVFVRVLYEHVERNYLQQHALHRQDLLTQLFEFLP